MQKSVKCFAEVQVADVSSSSLINHCCKVTEGHQICQTQFALIETMLTVTFNRLAITADNDIQALFMAIPFLLKVHCLCWACQHRMWGSTLTRVLMGSTEMRAVNSTGSQHCPWRLQILEHLSFGVSNSSLHIVLSLQFMYLKEVVTVKLLLR